ncbi:PAS domain S-box protein [Almyronema epifaneia]|uniref:histidine kinase n=1 Tax=Almyronema epifaneia S1 TaxID=2991925 RepID=A0ABW6I9A2_9CYAN
MTALLRILTVTRHSSDADFLEQVLSPVGYTVSSRQTAQAAFDFLAQTQPHLILVSPQLADTDGYQFCQQIKASERWATVPVVFIDTLTSDGDRQQVFAVGGCDYIAQPLLAVEVLAKVQTHLQRQQQQQQLAVHQERWQLLLQGLGVGVFEWNLQTGQHSMSAKTKAMLGYHPAELKGDYETWCQLLHPDDCDRTLAALKAYLNQQAPQYDIEYRLRGQKGDYRWIRARGRAKWDGQGQPLLIVGSHEDIHERKQAAEHLRQREQEFRALVENSPDIISRFDRQYRYLYINPPIQAITHIPPEDFIGRTSGEMGFATDLVKTWETTLEQVFVTQQEQTLNFVYNTPPSSTYWYARVVPEFTGDRVTSVLVVSRNVTPLRQVEDSLRRSEARFRAVFEQATVGINQSDLKTDRFICANQSFCQLLGYSEAELQQLTYQEISHQEDLNFHTADLQRLYQEDIPSLTFEKRYLRKDGTFVWTSVTLSLVHDEAGKAFADMAIVQDISDRKQAEAALEASEATNQAILHAIPDLLIYTDTDGNYIEHIPGHNVVPLISTPVPGQTINVHDLLPPALADQRRRSIQSALTTGQVQVYEQHLEVAGKLEDEEIRVVPLHNDRLLIMVRNITDRKRIEAELRRRQALLASLNEALPLGMLVANPSTREILAVNRQFFKVWRIEALEADVQAGLLSDKELLLQCLEYTDLEKLLATSKSPHQNVRVIEDELPLKDGRILRRIYGQVRSEATYYGYFYLFEDITLRKQAECDLRQGLEREQSMARLIKHMRQTLDINQIFATTVQELRQVLRCDRVVIYRLEGDGSGQFVAESAKPGWISVLAASEQLQQTLSVAKEATLEHFRQQAAAVNLMNQGEQAEGDRPEQFCICVADVSQAQLSASQQEFLLQLQAQAYIAAPIWQGQQLWGWLTTYQNSRPRHWQPSDMNAVVQISNQLGVAVQQAELFAQVQQQARQLRQTAEAANQANQAKSLFLANMSHELRTPLNVILGLAQVITRDRQITSTLREQVDIINRSGAHLLDLINSVLDLSKIEAGHISLQTESCDLAALIQAVSSMLTPRAAAKDLTLTTWLAPHVARYVKVDTHKLRQILINLIGNAIKFTPQGNVALRVATLPQITLPPATGGTPTPTVPLCFEVADTGVGIAPEDIDKIFTAFEQTNLGKDFTEGTGLGLTISRHFAELMGGNLTVESTVGYGSCFRLYLPVQVTTLADTQTSELPTVIGLEPSQKDYRILIVDDQRENRYMLQHLLQSIGLQVKEVASGREAIEVWQTWQPDLIWLDLRMPGMDGYAVTRQIRQQEAAKNRPPVCVIALSASALEGDREWAIAAGCDDFLSKPFRMQDLFVKMGSHLALQYRYASSTSLSPDAVAENSSVPKPTAESFQAMPASWVTQVRRAAELCDDVAIAQLIEQIPANQMVLKTGLQQLIHNFQFEKILQLTPTNPA